MKKLGVAIFCLLIVLCTSLAGCGSNYVTIDGVQYKKNTFINASTHEETEGYSVVGCKKGTEIVNIVAEIKGLPVISIDKFAFKDHTEIKEVTIPNSIKKISLNTAPFSRCDNIEKITMPSADLVLLFQMYGGGNYNDPIPASLKYVYLSDGCTKISTSSFYGCANLKEIHIPSSVTEIIDGTGYTIVGANGHPVDSSKFDSLPFFGCVNLTIYCEATSNPAGWGAYWNYIDSEHQVNVIWGNY